MGLPDTIVNHKVLSETILDWIPLALNDFFSDGTFWIFPLTRPFLREYAEPPILSHVPAPRHPIYILQSQYPTGLILSLSPVPTEPHIMHIPSQINEIDHFYLFLQSSQDRAAKERLRN